MFSYFGSKSKLINRYPKPKHDLIIEPFAGSARYALEYYERDVILNEINPVVFGVWRYLLEASKKDILSLPLIKIGESVFDYDLLDAERALIGFELCRGKAVPRKVVSKFSNWEAARQRIADNLYKIRRWKVYNENALNWMPLSTSATWFIDPPYILPKNRTVIYPYRQIDYERLAEFCKTRNGQTIVCAGTYDDWLPFKNLEYVWNSVNLNQEKIWTNET